MKKSLLISSLLFFLFSLKLNAAIIYVDSTHIGGTQNGMSWATAFSDFQSGINAANAGDSVWVAKGTYKPAAVFSSFSMKEGVKLFGGFLNTYTAFNQRNSNDNRTILTGNKSRVIENDNNALTNSAVIDGFRIEKGKPYNDFKGGGGMYNNYASPTINNCVFAFDTTNAGGGAISNKYASPVITNCSFLKNRSFDYGGAIRNLFSSPTITNCVFDENYADSYGGALASGGGSPIISHCTFSKNKTSNWGGAIYQMETSYSIIEDCIFFRNSCDTTVSGPSTGGAITMSNAPNTVIQNSIFTENFSGSGGALNLSSSDNVDSTIIRNCIFNKNHATLYGGAISVDGLGAQFNVRTFLTCQFSENHALIGGAISISDSEDSILNCRFSKNTATVGGGIAFRDSKNSVINQCSFIADSAQSGGALYILRSSPIVVNNLLAENHADSSGGGIHILQNAYGIPVLNNNTIVENYAHNYGGGIYCESNAYGNLSNSIIWNNNTGVDADISSTFIPTYSLVQGMVANLTNHNLDGNTNPLFNNAANGDYRLRFNSPCVNAGNNDSIPPGILTDLSDDDRITYGTVDMGAYEYKLSIQLGNDTMICGVNDLILDADNVGSSYLWSTGETTQNISVNSSGTYSVEVSNIWGTITDTIQIFMVAPPVVNLGNDITTALGTITLDAGNPGATYLWNTGATTQTITVNTSGTYSVVVTNAGGCSSSDTVVVSMSPDGIEDAPGISQTIKVYPNPAKDILHIDMNDLELLHSKVTLVDAFGRAIRTTVIESKLQEISMAGIASGIYVLKFENGAAVKIIKQ